MKEKNSDSKFVVYSVNPKTMKKTFHQSYEDLSAAREHKRGLEKLYKGYIQVGIEQKNGRFKSSVMKAEKIIKDLRGNSKV